MGSADRPGARPPAGGPAAAGTAGAGGPGARGAVLLVVALILGVVLLQEFDTGTVPFSEQVVSEDSPTTTRRAPSVSVLPPTSARAPRPPDQVRVLAANGTDTGGLAGQTANLLRDSGYNALAPLDATRDLATSQVQYRPDFEPEARVVAQLLQLPASSVVRMEDNPPVPDTRDADIIVAIGDDLQLPTATTTTTRRA